MLLDGQGQFKRGGDVVGRPVRDGNDKDLRFTVLIVRRQNNRARTVFGAFLAAFAMFTQSQIRITNDEASLRLWQRHGVQSLRRSSRWLWRGSIFEFSTASMMSAGMSAVAKTWRSRRLSR